MLLYLQGLQVSAALRVALKRGVANAITVAAAVFMVFPLVSSQAKIISDYKARGNCNQPT
jgi:hypothetical protein